MTNLVLPLGDLAVACEIADSLLAKSSEIAENSPMIKNLEEQFDKGVANTSPNIEFTNADVKVSESLPSGDELAESIEAFLKTQNGIKDAMKKILKLILKVL